MSDIVRRAEQVIDIGHRYGGAVRLCHRMAFRLEGRKVCIVQDVGACFIVNPVDGTRLTVDVGVCDEVLAVGVRHLVPIPPGDNLVQPVAVVVVVHPYLVDGLAVLLLAAYLDGPALIVWVWHLVSIEVGLHVEQLQASVRGGGDGQRQVNLL